jgi:hypothetical protein
MVTGGCAGRPFDPPRTDEIPDGPGVFSKGQDGMVLYDSDKGGLLPDNQEKDSQPSPEAVAGEPGPPDHEEFENFQQWLDWKKNAVGTPEYEEFQQWLQWRQYQQWEKSR